MEQTVGVSMLQLIQFVGQITHFPSTLTVKEEFEQVVQESMPQTRQNSSLARQVKQAPSLMVTLRTVPLTVVFSGQLAQKSALEQLRHKLTSHLNSQVPLTTL